MRCLLLEDQDRLILIDTGIGNKQPEKFFSYYYLHGDENLLKSISEAGYKADEITDVFFTHLHFDHCGGAVKRKENNSEEFEMVFKNAKYWTNKEHWNWAIKPNARERASYLKENFLPIQEQGNLHFIDDENPFSDRFDILYVDGHTEKQMLPIIKYKDKTIVFVADLIPSVAHIPVPYLMSYDIKPLSALEEKKAFLDEAVSNEYILFFEHDPNVECATVHMTIRGVRAKETFALKDIL
jgi:glyoxylase-like metal-dependent hydrolase (beta-lactamase superfamily II)